MLPQPELAFLSSYTFDDMEADMVTTFRMVLSKFDDIRIQLTSPVYSVYSIL